MQCQYLFNRRSRCSKLAGDNGFCSLCDKKSNRNIYNVSLKFPIDPIRIGDKSSLIDIGTLQELAQRVDLNVFLQANIDLCQQLNINDISLDITATAKYLSQIPSQPSTGSIYVLSRRTAVGEDNKHLILLGSWTEMANFRVMKLPSISDLDALLVIIWMMTKAGWRKDFFDWAGIDSETPLCKYAEFFRRKLD
jgi:hypothetical protein